MRALTPIDDAGDPRLEVFRRNERGLANRVDRRADDGQGLFMAEGDLVVERALDAGCRPHAVLVDAARPPARPANPASDTIQPQTQPAPATASVFQKSGSIRCSSVSGKGTSRKG